MPDSKHNDLARADFYRSLSLFDDLDYILRDSSTTKHTNLVMFNSLYNTLNQYNTELVFIILF